MAFKIPEYTVSVDSLRPGVFIRLKSTSWFNHPFLFTKFKIKDAEQIRVLKSMGITEVICVPEKSDFLPQVVENNPAEQAASEPTPSPPAPPSQPDKAAERLWQEKKARIELLKRKRQAISQSDERYRATLKQIPMLMHNLMAGSADAAKEAQNLVEVMVTPFLEDADAAIHLMDSRSTDEDLFNHSLNVSMLALMIGKSVGLDQQAMRVLGMGALLHDLGKNRIEKRVLRKPPPLTRAETELIRLHPRYGVDMVSKIEGFPVEAVKILQQHHERMDGSGYPDGLRRDAIAIPARITAIADMYDSLCNNLEPAKSLTPYQALSLMFTKCREQLDEKLFAGFIRSLGIYPPGTVIQLSNDAIGMVISVNPANPLKPSVLLYDPEVPKEEALIFNLDEDPDLSILGSILPGDLPAEIRNYLNPRLRISYFVDEARKSG